MRDTTRLGAKARQQAKGRYWLGNWWASGRLVSQVLALVCLLAILWLFNPNSAIRRVEVVGNRYTPEGTIVAQAGLVGRSPYSVDTRTVAASLVAALPLRKAVVSVRSDGTARIAVEELPPVLVWIANGRSYLLAADGRLLTEGTETGLPVVEASDLDPRAGGGVPAELVAEIVHISVSFPERTGATIALITYSSEVGISVQTQAGWQVRFGVGNIDEKFKILTALLAQRYQWTLLDLRFGYRPFLK